MKTVWILGAGASRADNKYMPLVSDFMRVADRVGWFAGDRGEQFLTLIASDFGFTPSEVLDVVNIEELLTLAACEAAWHGLEPRTDRAFERSMAALATLSSLKYLIADVLIQVQRDSFLDAESCHDELVNEMGGGDVVISYNYDLIADSALLRARKSTSANYRIPFDRRIARASGSANGAISDAPTDAPGEIDLLKLHGSLNWFHLAHEGLSSSSEFLFSAHPVLLYCETSSPEWQFVGLPPQFMVPRASYEPGRVNAVTFSPVIVPPTLEKADVWHSGGGLLRALWERARVALADAERVVLIGHSLSPADYQTRWLFRAALSTRQNVREIAVVNTCAADRSRLALFFQSLGTVKLYETVQDLLSQRTAG